MPTRLLFDLHGEVDDRGRCRVGGGAGQWQPTITNAQGVIFASVEGDPYWLVEIVRAQGGEGILLHESKGPYVTCPFLLQPGELVQATVIGGRPRSRVRGSVQGTQAWKAEELPPLYIGGEQTAEVAIKLPRRVRLHINLIGEECDA
jgi:hypothetical protein